MAETTYLRYIRLKCGITLMELEEHSSFSNQYLSLLELGRANCTPRNAETLDRAMLDDYAGYHSLPCRGADEAGTDLL